MSGYSFEQQQLVNSYMQCQTGWLVKYCYIYFRAPHHHTIIILLNNHPDGYGGRIVESECECGCNRYREPQTEEEEEEEEEETEFGPDKQEMEMLL